MRERLAQLARTKVAGVPLPVLFVVLVLIAAVIIHRRRAKAANPQDTSNLDTSSSVGAMAGGGYAGQDYSFPQSAGGGGSVDTTGSDFGGLTNPQASDTTVTGGTTPSTSDAGNVSPPKVSPAKVSHPAGHHPPVKPAPKAAHKAAAPKKRTTVHKAPVATTVVHKPAPVKKAPPHHPAPAKAPKKHVPARKPQRRNPISGGTGRRAVLG